MGGGGCATKKTQDGMSNKGHIKTTGGWREVGAKGSGGLHRNAFAVSCDLFEQPAPTVHTVCLNNLHQLFTQSV